MSIQGKEYQSVFSYLRSLNFHFLETWVIECVNYYKSANPNISFEVLKSEVKQQWLLVNLREIKVPCLPPDLKSKHKVILNGNYAVQVESMIDSSVSCYSQFQKLLKVNVEDVEATKDPKDVTVKSNRCLTFVISDGVQDLEAMEYQPIKKIKTNDPELLPGFKMIIMGPVECRKGMILLKDENVRISGGEVDTLTASNSLKRTLIKKLELDEGDYSEEADTASPIPVDEEEKENIENPSQGNNCVETLLSQNDDVFLSLPLETEILGQVQEPVIKMQEVTYENDLFEEDIHFSSEDLVNEEIQVTNSRKHVLPEEDLETPSQKRRSFDTELKQLPFKNLLSVSDEKDMFLDDFGEPQCIFTSDTTKTKEPVQTKLSSFFKNSESTSDKVYRTSNHAKPISVSNKPFVYLKQITSIKLNKPTIFIFKAIILTLKTKITVENDEYHLKAAITDGSLSVDVDFSSSILEDLLGFSPCEMAVMFKTKQTNTAISQRIKESFSKAQQKLISLNCLMEIKFFTDTRNPMILSLEEVTVQHLNALKERKSV